MTVVCKHPGCKKRASYNIEGLKARWCKAHKMTEMINVVSKLCPCGKQPVFNLPGELKGVCCAECKTSKMVNVARKLCPCGTIPSFNLPGENVGICCKECKKPGMVNVISKLCPCGKQPVFNLPGELKGVCCAECKTDEMVNVISKICPCGTIPIFNLPGENVGICCKECKTPGMVNVKDKKCPCGKQSSFNLPGENVGICCAECKTDEMVNVISKLCPCGKQPVFNLPGELKGVCCAECKKPEMINIVGKRCPGYNSEECPGDYRLVSGCQYCLSCDPDNSRRDKYKKYENAFFRHVEGKIDIKRREFIVNYDPSETTKKWARLDGIVFGDGIIVCLEVDENGHENYACDNSRMHMVTAELLKQYPGSDVCWVRVNPTTKHKNPWSVAAKQVRAERFDAVINAVNNVLENKTTDVIYIGFE